MTCTTVPDGVGQIRIGDAIWPVADLVVAILVSCVTMGAGLSASASAAVETGIAASMELMKTSKWPTPNILSSIFCTE